MQAACTALQQSVSSQRHRMMSPVADEYGCSLTARRPASIRILASLGMLVICCFRPPTRPPAEMFSRATVGERPRAEPWYWPITYTGCQQYTHTARETQNKGRQGAGVGFSWRESSKKPSAPPSISPTLPSDIEHLYHWRFAIGCLTDTRRSGTSPRTTSYCP
jgi:hypothetical protein